MPHSLVFSTMHCLTPSVYQALERALSPQRWVDPWSHSIDRLAEGRVAKTINGKAVCVMGEGVEQVAVVKA